METHKRASIQKTTLLRKESMLPKWIIMDAEGKTLGRFASEVAKILRGKHRVDYTPHVDCGDGVIIINADKIRVTGNKAAQKLYHSYSGYIGGLRTTSYQVMMEKKPTHIVAHAVKGMIPRTRLGKKQVTRLRVFAGTEHGMEAQQPVKANI